VTDDGGRRWVDDFVDAHHEELVTLRRHLHAHPEPSGEEFETTDLIVERLTAAGLRPRVLASGTGVVCDVGDGDGPPRVALRGDIDALSMEDGKDVSYRSHRPGVSHACGHDVHTVTVLGAGLALAGHLPEDRVRLIFEPSEERVPGGAVEVIEAGELDGIRSVFGLHCDPKLDAGCIGVRTGALTSAADQVDIVLGGPGGHTARPQLTVDLVDVAARVVREVPDVVARRSAPGEVLLVFGSVVAGDAPNVIPMRAVLRGSLRTPDRGVWDRAEELLAGAVAEVVEPTGATWELRHVRGVPPVVNHGPETELLAAAARRALGPDAVVTSPRSAGGDSFAWYLEHSGGSYARLGTHPPGRAERMDLHAGSFDVDEAAIDVGVRVLVHTALDAVAATSD
jgi:amidohydrolase